MSRRINTALLAAQRSQAAVFAALGDRTRLQLLGRLSLGEPCSISELSSDAAVTRQAITKHLEALAGAGIVRGSRQGRERIWQLETKRLEQARRYLDQISTQWDAAIDRLRALVEDS